MPHTKRLTKRTTAKSKKADAANVCQSSPRKPKASTNVRPLKKKRHVTKPQGEDSSPIVSEPLFKAVQAVLPEPNSEMPERTATAQDDSESVVEQEGDFVVTVDRRRVADRRSGTDRRQVNIPVAVERRQLDRRAKVPRRRQIDPTTCERDYTPEEIEFMIALDEYKRSSGRMFPTCSEILEVIKKLGYEKRPQTTVASPELGSSIQTTEDTVAIRGTSAAETTSPTSPPLGTCEAEPLTSAIVAEPQTPTTTPAPALLSSTLPQPELTGNPGCSV